MSVRRRGARFEGDVPVFSGYYYTRCFAYLQAFFQRKTRRSRSARHGAHSGRKACGICGKPRISPEKTFVSA